ncbi:CbiQ family ECF transporter T component [Vagococcus sp. JNUCC 83]
MSVTKSSALTLSILLLLLTIELSFTSSIHLNLFVVIVSAIYLISKKKWFGLLGLIFFPLIPALGTYWSVYLYGNNPEYGLVLVSRTFAFAAIGMVFAFGVDLEELLLILEQKNMSTSFVYGILVVLHAMPMIKNEVISLKEASLFRGKTLHFYSPLMYLKVIFVANHWRDAYTEAMFSRGFDEEGTRTHYTQYKVCPKGLIALIGLTVVSQIILVIT